MIKIRNEDDHGPRTLGNQAPMVDDEILEPHASNDTAPIDTGGVYSKSSKANNSRKLEGSHPHGRSKNKSEFNLGLIPHWEDIVPQS